MYSLNIKINNKDVLLTLKKDQFQLLGDCLHEALLGFQPCIDKRVRLRIDRYNELVHLDYENLSEQEDKELTTRFHLAVDAVRSLTRRVSYEKI